MADETRSSSNLKETNEASYRLHNFDHPGMPLVNTTLDGKNYFGWSIAIRTALEAKDKVGFIDGSLPAPKAPAEYKKWKTVDSMIKSWIRNSFTKELADTFICCISSKNLWDVLEESKEDKKRCNCDYQVKSLFYLWALVWINTAVQRNVEELDISLSSHHCALGVFSFHLHNTCGSQIVWVAPAGTPTFHNLITSHISLATLQWEHVMPMIQKSPKLQNLSIEKIVDQRRKKLVLRCVHCKDDKGNFTSEKDADFSRVYRCEYRRSPEPKKDVEEEDPTLPRHLKLNAEQQDSRSRGPTGAWDALRELEGGDHKDDSDIPLTEVTPEATGTDRSLGCTPRAGTHDLE
ncbi:uncharacterized protein G2W53_006222 [Senna tora]|uniref:Retrotransposon Copia-like N-terminal domain-containing protein n=1 Tax=Senna tora TaxID=362788 RepID=A0A834X479_9FABA|nr:uncharacterized protein G2W53_006222 [Senna tora]